MRDKDHTRRRFLAFAVSTLGVLAVPATSIATHSNGNGGPPQDFAVGSITGQALIGPETSLHIAFNAHMPADGSFLNPFRGHGQMVARYEPATGEAAHIKGDFVCGHASFSPPARAAADLVYRLRQPAPAEFADVIARDFGAPGQSEFPDQILFRFRDAPGPSCPGGGNGYRTVHGNLTVHDE